MKMSMRWYGEEDPVSLKYINQIPGVEGIISAIYDVPVGDIWPYEKVKDLKDKIESYNLKLLSIESLPVHEKIKLGMPDRDKYIDNYKESIKNISKAGIEAVTYNFMPVFDWTRTDVNYELPDGSNTLIYDNSEVEQIDPIKDNINLPGWDVSYKNDELKDLIEKYHELDKEDLWDNLKYFLKSVIPTAEKYNVKLAIHPDDPPWSIFGIPRIITSKANIARLLKMVDNKYNGLAICSGSLGVDKNNNLPEIIREFGDRIYFAHMRNVKISNDKDFIETGHYSKDGSLDMVEILKAYYEVGFNGPMRPDHGRMIWGETGKPGYGLYDRALGAAYLNGIWETLNKIYDK